MKQLNYYLQEKTYKGAAIIEIENSIREAADILHNESYLDFFCMNYAFYEQKVERKKIMQWVLFDHDSPIDNDVRLRLVPEVLGHFDASYGPFATIKDFKDNHKKGDGHFFLGINFDGNQDYEIETCGDFKAKREKFVQDIIKARNCGIYMPFLLKRVIFTKAGYDMLVQISDFRMVIADIIKLDKYVERCWYEGGFSINDVRQHTSIDISDESDTVKQNRDLRRERHFAINNRVGSQDCFIHMKVGDTRIYLYPDSEEKKVYIPYVGRHLPTQRY